MYNDTPLSIFFSVRYLPEKNRFDEYNRKKHNRRRRSRGSEYYCDVRPWNRNGSVATDGLIFRTPLLFTPQPDGAPSSDHWRRVYGGTSFLTIMCSPRRNFAD